MSTLKVNAIQNTSGVEQYLCKAWVNFDGNPVTIRSSGNVTSITDNGTGNFTVNFTNAFADANYAVLDGTNRNGVYADSQNSVFFSPTTTAVSVGFGAPQGTAADPEAFCIAIFS